FMVMEYLEGHDLSKEIATRKVFSLEEAIDYILQAGDALAEAHELAIVHRDMKPPNMFLAETPRDGRQIKVLDFGISKIIDGSSVDVVEAGLMEALSVLGSPAEMFPAQK